MARVVFWFLCAGLLAGSSSAVCAATPDEIWVFQGIEDINAMATLPDVDGDGVADILIETYDAGADGDHIYLLSGGSSGVPPVIWSARPNSGASNGGGWGDECLAICDDLSGDGFPDVLLGTAWGNRSVHAFDGIDGTLLWTFDTYNEYESGWVYCVRPHPDRTGDGKPEVVFGAGSNNDTGYMLDGADGSVIWRFYGSADAIGHTLSVPDMNGDDGPDVIFCGWDDEHRVFCVTGAGSSVPTFIWSADTGASNHAATLIDDITGDGFPEVVASTWRADWQIRCLSGADGSPVWEFHNGLYNYGMRVVTLNDVNDDGYRDVAVGSFDRALRVVSGLDGSMIWQSYAGSLNGGDFWSVDRVDDLTGDGKDEVVGGSFDYNVYLFNGANGDTLWMFNTGHRLKSVRGTADLSGNGTADVLGGEQYLSSGGRAHALEGADVTVPVPDLPQIEGRAGWLSGGFGEDGSGGAGDVELRWRCDEPRLFRVYRVTATAAKAAAAAKLELAKAFERGELKTRDVLDARLEQTSGSIVNLTPEPLAPEAERADGWHYRLVDASVAGGEVVYRVALVLDGGGEMTLLELTPSGEIAPAPLLLSAAVTPNPFNPRTVVRFDLDRPAAVSLTVFDVAGRRLFRREPQPFAAGLGALTWDGRGFGGRELPSGVYLLRLDAGAESRVLRAVLVR